MQTNSFSSHQKPCFVYIVGSPVTLRHYQIPQNFT